MKELTEQDVDKHIEILQKRKDTKAELGGCPPMEYRGQAHCFYCDDCWISALKKYKEEKFNKV